MTKSKIFLFSLLSFILGIGLASCLIRHPIANLFYFISLLFLFILFILLFNYSNLTIRVICFCCLAFLLGMTRLNLVFSSSPTKNIQNYFDQEVSLTGFVCHEPDYRIEQGKITVKINKISQTGKNEQVIDNKLLITVPLYPHYQYGDVLNISGKLIEPQSFDDFNYPAYLRRYGITALMYRPQINKIPNRQSGNSFYRQILQLKQINQQFINRYLPEPNASFLSAILLGNKHNLSTEWQNKLNFTGARHIIAISGLHIVILITLLMSFLLYFLRRDYAFYLTSVLVILFIIMVGCPSSAIRAGMIALLILFAEQIGRSKQKSNLLVFIAVVMLLGNPLLLFYDIGFQLSFVAVLGIIYFYPFLRQFFIRYLGSKIIADLLGVTLSAQLFTFPLVWYHFGMISWIAPLTNLFVLPIIPYLMLSGLAFLIVSSFLPILASIVVLPVWICLTYLTQAIAFFSPSSLKQVVIAKQPPIGFIILCYCLLVGLVFYIRSKKQLIKEDNLSISSLFN